MRSRSHLLLFLLLLSATAFAQEAKLWPPRGNNRPLLAASQALWWNKDDPEARKLKARALDFAGRYAEAEQAARYALAVAPKDPEVQRILGRSLLHQGKLNQAKAALEQAGQLGDASSRSLATMLRPDRMSVGDLPANLSRALVQIQDDQGRCVGTGCFVSTNGIILTAAHVVAGRRRFTIRNAFGKVFPAQAVCPGDFSADAVLLRTEATSPDFLILSKEEPPIDTPLTVSGFPLSIDLPLTSRGTVRAKAKDGVLLSTVPLMPGQSGSPVLNPHQQIVGVASRGSLALLGGGAPARSEAVSTSALHRLWDFTAQPQAFSDIRLLPKWTSKNTFFDPAVSSAEHTVFDQDYAKSEEAISTVIAQHPEDAGLLLRRAMTRIALNQIPAATQDAQLACLKEPKNPEPHRFLCGIYLGTGRRPDAIEEMSKAFQLDPQDADTAEGLSELLLASARYPEALPFAEDAVRLNPESPRAWSILCAARLATGNFAGARQAGENATKKDPEDPRAWVQLAASLNASHEFVLAISVAQTATRLAPNDARAWLNLATAYTGLDQYAEAVGYAERATQIEPQNPTGWKLLTALYGQLNRPADALSARARAQALIPTTQR